MVDIYKDALLNVADAATYIAMPQSTLGVWKKQETIQHPFLDEKVEVGLLPYAQALLLSRRLRKTSGMLVEFMVG